ncbi:MAG: DUF4159 domain-containing protein [Gemmatimonadetes bacterium]|nr:DUF4159 domain-containing protein [Gemmatimonadota bacterium]
MSGRFVGPILVLLGMGFAAPAPAQAPPGTMAIGRLHYDGGGDWYANPSALPNLIAAARQRAGLRLAEKEKVVRLVDDDIWNVAYLHVTGHGNLRWSEQELVILRRWLVAGGFLHVSDNYGLDESFRREVARLFPERPLEPVPGGHPIYHLVYDFPQGVPKIHEHDGKPAEGLGIFLDGRLALFYDYQSDLSDGWEDPAVHRDPAEKHEAALRMGVNLIAYAIGFGGTQP